MVYFQKTFTIYRHLNKKRMINVDEIKFSHPFCMTVAGPTQSGKSYIVFNLLKNQKNFIIPKQKKIIYCYTVWQPLYSKMLVDISGITFNKGIPDIDQEKDVIVVLDDLMNECLENKNILSMFTIGSHHKNISVIFLTQNIYEKGKYARSISLNSHYLIIFQNLRDKAQIQYLGRQLYPQESNFFTEVYNDAVSKNSAA